MRMFQPYFKLIFCRTLSFLILWDRTIEQVEGQDFNMKSQIWGSHNKWKDVELSK